MFLRARIGANWKTVSASVMAVLTCSISLATWASTVSVIDFGFTGAPETFVVPAGVTEIEMEAWGAQGYTPSSGNLGGQGGYAAGTLAVTPGVSLRVYVGGRGGVADVTDQLMGGGFNGGGHGVVWANGNGLDLAGGGGGASDVRLGGDGFGDRVLVAGGGGGATNNGGATGGAGGGLTGGDGGPPTSLQRGFGGTQTAGGAVNAGFGFGGDAINDGTTGWVGGGGGGWYGGGASSAHRGGGGGSSYIADSFDNPIAMSGIRTGDGLVRFTLIPEPGAAGLALLLVACGRRRPGRASA